jgi:prephenate dehydrogenase
MHILSRPSNTPDKKDRSVALIDYDQWIGSLRLVNAVKEITDSQIVWFSNRKVHDMTMAYQQALVHRILLIMGDMLRGLPGETYISKRVKELEQRIRLRDPILYKLIQKNQYLPEVRKDFNKRLRSFNITKEMKQEK